MVTIVFRWFSDGFKWFSSFFFLYYCFVVRGCSWFFAFLGWFSKVRSTGSRTFFVFCLSFYRGFG